MRDTSFGSSFSIKSFVVYILIGFTLFFVDRYNTKYFSFFRQSINDAIVYSIIIIKSPFYGVNYLIKSSQKLFDESIQIKEIDKIKIELESQKKLNLVLEKQLEDLKKVVGQERYIYQSSIAKVISYKNNIYTNSIILSKGSSQNVQVGDPVVFKNNLVGKIVEVNSFSSRALLITSRQSRIPVRIGDQKYNAILTGSNDKKNNLDLVFLPKEYKLNNGDILYTQSIEGTLPDGILVGTLVIDSKENFYIDSSFDFNQLDLVTILHLQKKKE